MKPKLWLRTTLSIAILASGLVLAVAASAHSCSPDADPPVDIGNYVRGHGEVDCTGNQPADVLTVRLWRRCTGCPDDQWGEAQDGYPPNLPGYVYSATVTACEAADPPDDFLTEVRTANMHGATADAISGGSNLDC
jgi:hypothetical protein